MCETLNLTSQTPVQTDDLLITRVFAATRERVFGAWTDPEQMMRWWGPTGFTCPACRIDLRPGGAYLNCMRSTDGQEFWSTGVYREIVAPERLVCTDSFADAEGSVLAPVEFGMSETWPVEALLTLTLVERDGQTELTLIHGLAGAPEPEIEMCRLGWNESLDKLAAHLADR